MRKPLRPMPEFDADEVDALHAAGWRPDGRASFCPDSSLLVVADAGVLDERTEHRVRAHMGACPTCRALAGDLVHVLDADPSDAERDGISARVLAPPARSNRLVSSFMGAGLLAAAALAALVVVPNGDVAQPPVPGIAPRAAVPAAAPTVFVGGRPAIPRSEPELTLRGESSSMPLAEQIGRALDVAEAGEVTEASAGLSELVRKNPASADVHLALGATLLRAGRLSEALPTLERAKMLAGMQATEEFDWHLAVALARSREFARAEAILAPLCGRNSMRGALACAGLAEVRRPPRLP